MTPEAYGNRGTTHPGNAMSTPVSHPHRQFARALSAAVARRMKLDPSLNCLYALYKLIPETAGIPPMTVYSSLRVSNRPAVWVMHYVALALGTTLSTLIQEAQDIIASGRSYKTAWEEFKGASPAGRKAGPPRDERQRWTKRKADRKVKQAKKGR